MLQGPDPGGDVPRIVLAGFQPRGGRKVLAPYLPIVAMFVLAAGFAVFSVGIAGFVGPKRYNRAKLDAYECGIEPTPRPIGGGRFPVKFYLTAMLFIVFDIEIIFLYPWAVANRQLGVFGLVEMALFIGTVFIAYAYVWRRGGLDWD
jgi:NADH-quinone oxidoreductase subunit A